MESFEGSRSFGHSLLDHIGFNSPPKNTVPSSPPPRSSAQAAVDGDIAPDGSLGSPPPAHQQCHHDPSPVSHLDPGSVSSPVESPAVQSHDRSSGGSRFRSSYEDSTEAEPSMEATVIHEEDLLEYDHSLDMDLTRVVSQPKGTCPIRSEEEDAGDVDGTDDEIDMLDESMEAKVPLTKSTHAPLPPSSLPSLPNLSPTSPGESFAHPSSSNAVANNLLKIRSSGVSKKRKMEHQYYPPDAELRVVPPTPTDSSADEDISRSMLVSSPNRIETVLNQETDRLRIKMWHPSPNDSRPETSTPAFMNPPPPHPVLHDQTQFAFLPRPPTSVPMRNQGLAPKPAVYGTSAALKNVPPRPPKKKYDEWLDESSPSQSNASVGKAKELVEESGEENELGEMGMRIDGETRNSSQLTTPRSTQSAPSATATMDLGGPIPVSAVDDDESQVPPIRRGTPLFGPVFETQIETQAESLMDGITPAPSAWDGFRLTEISDLKSTAEDKPSDVDVEPTQIHDCFRSTAADRTAPLSDEFPSPQSSLERPLAQALASTSRMASPTPSVAASAPTHSNRKPRQSAMSSNGVVPDSQGGSTPVAAAAASPAVTSASVEEEESDDATDTGLDNVLAVPNAAGGVDKMVLEDDKPVPPVDQAKPKRQARAMSKAGKSKAQLKKSVAAKKDMGRDGVRASASSSRDEIDFLSRPSPSVPLPAADDQGEGEALEETNYDEAPNPHNARRRSEGRHVASPNPDFAPAVRASKRKSLDVTAPIEPPAKRAKSVQSAPSKPHTRTKRASRPPAKATRVTRAPSQAVSGLSRASRPTNVSRHASPVMAGSSRGVHCEPVSGMVSTYDRRTTEPSAPDVRPAAERAESRLPASAPFKRVFALWKNDQFMYPGLIAATTSSGGVKIIFDDNSTADLKYDALRRCELKQGDTVRYRGDEIELATQAETLTEDVRIVRVERGMTGEDAEGELDGEDVAVVAHGDMQASGGKKERLKVESLCVAPAFTVQFDDRKLTAQDIAGLEGRSRKATEPLAFVRVPEVDVTSFTPNAKVSGVLKGMAFIVSLPPSSAAVTPPSPPRKRAGPKTAASSEKSKEVLQKEIEAEGGSIVEVKQLFGVTQREGKDLSLEFPIDAFKGIDTILLVTDRPVTTPKSLVSLALTIPVVSQTFITQSITKGQRLDWRIFALSAGFLSDADGYVLGGQIRSVTKAKFDLASIQAAWTEGGPFMRRTVLVVATKKEKTELAEEVNALRQIFGAGGARKVDFVGTPAAAADAQDYDFVILEEGLKPPALRSHPGLRTRDWMKRSLVAGKILD